LVDHRAIRHGGMTDRGNELLEEINVRDVARENDTTVSACTKGG
jgi:hypothetical protein